MVRRLTPLVASAVLAAALAGCGRKGPLEPPPGLPTPPASPTALETRQTVLLQNTDNPGLIQSPNRVYEVPAGEKLKAQVAQPPRPINEPSVPSPPRTRPFILDPLLN